MFKIGLDLHGVIDSNPELFKALSKPWVDSGYEVHVITGPSRVQAIQELEGHGFLMGIHYTHLCSIIDYRKAQGIEVSYDGSGNGWMRTDVWDTAKAEYCQEQGISVHLDDSSSYGEHFTGDTLYFQKIEQTESAKLKREVNRMLTDLPGKNPCYLSREEERKVRAQLDNLGRKKLKDTAVDMIARLKRAVGTLLMHGFEQKENGDWVFKQEKTNDHQHQSASAN